MTWRSILLGLAGLAISAALIFFAQPLAEFLLSSFGMKKNINRPVLAKVIQVDGEAFVRPVGRGGFERLMNDEILHQRDEIKTEKGGRVHIRFESNYEIEIDSESQAILDAWPAEVNRQPKYLNFIRGNYRLIASGSPGELYIVLEDQVFAPESRPKKSETAYKIDTEAVSQPQVKATKDELETLPEQVSNEKTTKNRRGQKLPDKLNLNEVETLSSAYIESVLTSRAPLFRRCQLTSLRDNKLAHGNMLFSLIIEPNGRVDRVKLLQKDIKNSDLESCVSSVIERTKFKPFQGKAISLSYPLNFQ